MFGFNTCPENIISNYMCIELFGLDYDKDGKITASGKVNENLKGHGFHERTVTLNEE